MPDFPESAVDAAAEALWEHSNLDPERVRILARAALDAAWPHLASAVAEKIQAYRDNHGPDKPAIPFGRGGGEDWRRYLAWHRHFGIAAQVAGLALFTEDEKKRIVADALNRGEFIACDPPEMPGDQ